MKKPFYIALAVIMVFSIWFGYEKYVIVTCSNEAREEIRDKKLNATEGKQAYDVFYRACAGRKGIER